ncbi:MAG: hypothetical protein KC646_05505 [Candidatus Cloacimonetes bacterium]|nr:hypothetical protein [Candidatus Cloacimonadota bacterium]
MNQDKLFKELYEKSKEENKILTPVEVINYFHHHFDEDPNVSCETWGIDNTGRPILSYTFGHGPQSILLYAFADPAEAVGGTGIIALSKLLMDKQSELSKLNYSWVIVPCLNFVDQPNHGLENSKLQKTAAQEVDWCVSDPRPETTAILQIASAYKPIFTFPLHDEFHHPEYVAPYCGLGKAIDVDTASNITALFAQYNMQMNHEYADKELGEGFFIMESIGEEIKNSTFYAFSQYGQVLVCEIPNTNKANDSELVFLQMAIGFTVLNDTISKS